MIWILFIGTLLISLLATGRVKAAYLRYSRVPASSGVTGAQAAYEVLRSAGINQVEVVAHDGMLSDHYNPLTRRLVLSSANYHGRSVAALGIAAHEAGHALQHAQGYLPLQLRMAAVGMTNFASQIVTVLPFLFLFTGMMSMHTGLTIMAIGWGIIMAFNLVTLPVEFDASARAKQVLSRMGLVAAGSEAAGVNKVLNAAAWTYVAAFLSSLAYFLFYLLPLLTGGRRN